MSFNVEEIYFVSKQNQKLEAAHYKKYDKNSRSFITRV